MKSYLEIRWESNIGGEGFEIELYKGSSYLDTLNSFTINDGIEYCQIPEDCDDGTNYNIRISAVSSGEYDYSEGFSIIKRKIVVVNPYLNRTYYPHTVQEIEWYSFGLSSKVKIDLYLNSTYILEIINETENDEVFVWNVWQGDNYSSISRNNYQVRIQDCYTPKYYSFSSFFTITDEKFLKINTPIENSTFIAGNVMHISWNSDSPCEELAIFLKKDGKIVLNISIAENTGIFDWRIPYGIPISDNYSIFIKATDNSCWDSCDFITIRGTLNPFFITITIAIIAVILSCAISIFIFKYRKRILNKR